MTPSANASDPRLRPAAAWAAKDFRGFPNHGPKRSKHWAWANANANGNGLYDPGEFTDHADIDPGRPHAFDLGADGTVRYHGVTWIAEAQPTLNLQGSPVWTPGTQNPVPTPFDTGGLDNLRYVEANDTMYLTGFTADRPNTSRWPTASRVLARYPDWSAGNRTPDWTIELPYVAHRDNPTLTSGNTRYNANAVSLNAFADHVFVGLYAPSLLMVLDAETGQETRHPHRPDEVLRLMPGPEVLSLSTDLDRGPLAVNMFRRDNGEYIALMQDDMFAKTIVLRWKPEN